MVSQVEGILSTMPTKVKKKINISLRDLNFSKLFSIIKDPSFFVNTWEISEYPNLQEILG